MKKLDLFPCMAAQVSLSKAAAANVVFPATDPALSKGESVTIAASTAPSFDIGKTLCDAVR